MAQVDTSVDWAGSEGPTPAVGTGLRGRLYERVRAFLSLRTAPWWIMAVSILLVSASLDTGFGADDHIQRTILKGAAVEGMDRASLDLFRFAQAETNQTLLDNGTFPWWADPHSELSFFRPLTSATHWVDYVLWADSAFMAHLHSVLWFALALLGLWSLYRRLIPTPWVAALALFFYALDDARGAPIAWIANRNAIIASAFSIWTLVFHHRARMDGWKPGLPLALLSLGCGLLAAEGTIAICAYLFTYALFMDSGSLRRRLLRLAPYAVVVVAWRVVGKALEYGVAGSGVYVDPLAEPVAFVGMVAERLPILLLGQVAAPWSELWNAIQLILPGLELVLMVFALAVLAVLGTLIAPLWRGDATLRFWIGGAVLAAVPICATFPADRLLPWVAIGGAPVLAILLVALVERRYLFASALWTPRVVGLTALGLFGIHMVFGPIMLPWRARGIVAVRQTLELGNQSVPSTADIEDKTVVYVNPPGDPFPGFLPFMRADAGQPAPGVQRWLSSGITDVSVERVDESTLRVRPDRGFLLSPSERMLRSPRHPFAQGEVVALEGMTVTITELTEDDRPSEALIRFDKPLDDEGYVWLKWEGRSFVPFDLPAVGESVVLPKVDLFELAYG